MPLDLGSHRIMRVSKIRIILVYQKLSRPVRLGLTSGLRIHAILATRDSGFVAWDAEYDEFAWSVCCRIFFSGSVFDERHSRLQDEAARTLSPNKKGGHAR